MPGFRDATLADLPRATALSAGAGWNQNAADWALFLRHGAVRVLDDGDPACLAASAAVLPYGRDLAWVSMVLVRPDRRREGLATALLRKALEQLSGTRSVALDATPEGAPVYAKLGFVPVFGFSRWRLGAALQGVADCAPLDAVLAADEVAFGADRGFVLRDFAQRLPQGVLEGGGFALARDGRMAPQIGPVIARSEAAALALIGAASRAIGTPALLDLRDDAEGIAAALRASGATKLRPFTRMLRGAALPGDATRIFAVAGPEFG